MLAIEEVGDGNGGGGGGGGKVLTGGGIRVVGGEAQMEPVAIDKDR